MEQFSRECLEIDTEVHGFEHPDMLVGSSSMDKVYDRAAKLVKRTLDVEGVLVMDVSHTDILESMSAEGSVSVALHHGDPGKEMTRRQLTTEEYYRLNSFFDKYPDGRISEGIIPPSFKPFLPMHVQYALSELYFPSLLLNSISDWSLLIFFLLNLWLAVPIFNIDKRPFALLCAYNTHEHAKRFVRCNIIDFVWLIFRLCQAGRTRIIILTGYRCHHPVCCPEKEDDPCGQSERIVHIEVSPIWPDLLIHGSEIWMDGLKHLPWAAHTVTRGLYRLLCHFAGYFIQNSVIHLQILAAAELLSESPLNHSQQSFLHTVQACGTSLVETVNHVLDFTKLSGNSKAGGVENIIVPSPCVHFFCS